MDVTTLVRQPAKVIDSLDEQDHQLFTKKGCKIYAPSDYINKGLMHFSDGVSLLGVFIIVINDKEYALSNCTAMVTIKPNDFNKVMMGDTEFYCFEFNAGGVVVENTMVVKELKLTNSVVDYFCDYGLSPWFITYLDHAELLYQCKYFNGLDLGKQVVMDCLTAHITRSPKNFKKYFRHDIKNVSEINTRPVILPARDIANNTTSNLALVNGSELQRSIKAAVLAQRDRPEPLEQLMME